jgi:hypothetical protein
MPRAQRPCVTTGCGSLVAPGTTRCADCAREYERKRGSSAERGYGRAHRQLRARYQRDGVVGLPCPRCGKAIRPGEPWDLDHDDRDRSKYLGPSHARCNRAWNRKDGGDSARS